jgi:hypothetical protein
MTTPKGIGKCAENHLGSYGYPTRPESPYPYCPQCGNGMVWICAKCSAALPEDSAELVGARFCRYCGASYFDSQEPGVIP